MEQTKEKRIRKLERNAWEYIENHIPLTNFLCEEEAEEYKQLVFDVCGVSIQKMIIMLTYIDKKGFMSYRLGKSKKFVLEYLEKIKEEAEIK